PLMHPPTSTLSLHDALPIFALGGIVKAPPVVVEGVEPELADRIERGNRAARALDHVHDVAPERRVVAECERDVALEEVRGVLRVDRKSTRLNSSHVAISYAV